MQTLILIAIAGLAAQLVDGGLGMGFGVTSTTILIMLAGLGPAQASAVVHTAEVGTTLVSGISHWKFGNVDWKVVLRLGAPGAIGAFAGATFLSNLSMEAAAPVTSAILALIGINLVWRFSKGRVRRTFSERPHSAGFLGGLGIIGGFVDASGGGGWGPVTTSTLMTLGRTEPRKIVGTVNTAEFLVSVAATLGFIIGLWSDLVDNLAAVVALLIGGAIAAPIAAWMISRVNATVLGGFVGTAIVALNAPKVWNALGVEFGSDWIVQLAIVLIGVTFTIIGIRRYRTNLAEALAAEAAADAVGDRTPLTAEPESTEKPLKVRNR
ncbi:sulfite exporter TauE/SafE family protein [Corynebacterium gallinarum]|uniref:Probable membrane transporter protein n=1 Tax=Corynebacterium gallinarum TaxID=2762214 RepID=A0A8I0LH76_9CORY|nr:sulfite exporter TauE/SafE family protein [Corynebacterium gallinarum]MBD8030170.1 sulfite exporter TauE/SafE family protein [Corynebacterium gallinarum]